MITALKDFTRATLLFGAVAVALCLAYVAGAPPLP